MNAIITDQKRQPKKINDITHLQSLTKAMLEYLEEVLTNPSLGDPDTMNAVRQKYELIFGARASMPKMLAELSKLLLQLDDLESSPETVAMLTAPAPALSDADRVLVEAFLERARTPPAIIIEHEAPV